MPLVRRRQSRASVARRRGHDIGSHQAVDVLKCQGRQFERDSFVLTLVLSILSPVPFVAHIVYTHCIIARFSRFPHLPGRVPSPDNADVQKVFHFDSPRDRYRCDAAIVSCFDSRFQHAFTKYLEQIGILYPDLIKIAGGAKSLASPERESDREFLIDQIRKSVELHQTERVILTLHSDCGAYGGLGGAFNGDEGLEVRCQAEEMRRAAVCLRTAVPGITVEGYFANFEGIWEVDLTRPPAD